MAGLVQIPVSLGSQSRTCKRLARHRAVGTRKATHRTECTQGLWPNIEPINRERAAVPDPSNLPRTWSIVLEDDKPDIKSRGTL